MNIKKGMVSVIIPVYNRETVLEECIASVQNQSYQNWEVILIDDGSTDNTKQICHRLMEKDHRFVLREMEHAGVSAARNKGMDTAKGEFLFFLDSDDVIHPLLLETMVQSLQETKAAIAGTTVFSIRQENWQGVYDRINRDTGPGETEYQTHQQALNAMFLGGSPLNMIGGTMLRRELVLHTRFCSDLFIGEDFWFLYENMIKGADAVFLKQKWYYVRIHEKNSSWDYSFQGFWTRFYRRKLVWESEERFGRLEHADLEKRNACYCFWNCLDRNRWQSSDCCEMRRVMMDYRTILIPALSWKLKIRYCLSVWLPPVYAGFMWLRRKIKVVS